MSLRIPDYIYLSNYNNVNFIFLCAFTFVTFNLLINILLG